jgi:hypothetical protein
MAPWGIFALILLVGLVLLALAAWMERRSTERHSEDPAKSPTTDVREPARLTDGSSGNGRRADTTAASSRSHVDSAHQPREAIPRGLVPESAATASEEALGHSAGTDRDAISDRPPTYHTLEDLARQAPDLQPVSDRLRQDLQNQLGAETTYTSAATLLDAVFATHVDRRAIADDPLVLVCAEPVQTDRELIPVLRTVVRLKRPVVIAAPAFDPTSQQMLAANELAGTVQIIPLVGTQPVLAELAAAAGCTWVERTDLQAGYLPATVWGRADRVVADTQGCAVIPVTIE